MVCYYYPPIGGIGTERPLAFSRLLPEFGWRPIVVTPRVGTMSTIPAREGMDIPPEVTVRRTCNPDLSFRLKKALRFDVSQPVEQQLGRDTHQVEGGLKTFLLRSYRNWFEMPDRTIDWYPFLVWTARKIIAEEGVDVIYSKSPPNTSALAMARLSKSTGIPWVADLPDLWTHLFSYSKTGAAMRLDRRLERYALERSTFIVNFTEPTRESAGVSDLVETLGQVPYAEALARQKGADALLYLQWEPEGEVGAYSKFWQYLGARKPILAMATTTPGELDDLIDQSQGGVIARSADDARIRIRKTGQVRRPLYILSCHM